MGEGAKAHPPVEFETHPSRYRRLKLTVEGPVAKVALDIPEDAGLRPGYVLKLNSYDLGVDIELADVVTRLRFEHPEVSCVLLTSATDGIFSSGANIFMLGSSTHGFKVNFCKFTNETRLAIEDASRTAGQHWVAAVNGVCSGGGYELALACETIFLIDDKRSAVALPEVPYLGVLPGTGGLTRVVDKRKVRKDRADIFCSLAEGLKGKKAKAWGLVDEVYPSSRFKEEVAAARRIAGSGHTERKGIELEPLAPEISAEAIAYRHVTLTLGPQPRVARLELRGPEELPAIPKGGTLPASWYPLRLFRELDDALCRLRFNHPEIGLVLVSSRGAVDRLLELDAQLERGLADDNWFVREVVALGRRVWKRMDLTAKSFFALVDAGSCFAGTLAEAVLASDRVYMLAEDGVEVALSALNGGAYPMATGLTRLESRWLAAPERAKQLATERPRLAAAEAEEAGLVTAAVDALDWEDETRLAIEERASLSPDALTGMEASLRFAGPETMETKIFGRLSAWQNWIFQRPNAVGPRGALTLYGQPESPEFDWMRT